MIAMIILVAGGLLSYWIRSLVLAIIVGATALYVGLRRDSYLPETVLPCSLLQERIPEHADTEVNVSGLEPGAKLLYWAAEPSAMEKTDGLANIKDWQRAYLEFANAGVTRADAALQCPYNGSDRIARTLACVPRWRHDRPRSNRADWSLMLLPKSML